MHIAIEEIDSLGWEFTIEFYGMVDHVDFFKEFEEGFHTVCPDQKYIVFESGVPQVFTCDPGVNMFSFEFTHKGIRVRTWAFAAHCTALDLDEVLVIKGKVV